MKQTIIPALQLSSAGWIMSYDVSPRPVSSSSILVRYAREWA